MTVGIERLIELAAANYTLYPGDVILTGTPEELGPSLMGIRSSRAAKGLER